MFENSLPYSGALIWTSIPVEIRNTNMIDAFAKKCFTWMKDLLFLYSCSHYLHRRISLDGLQNLNVFTHTLSKVDFLPSFYFVSLTFYSQYSPVFVNVLLSCLLFHVCYACVKRSSQKIGYTN